MLSDAPVSVVLPAMDMARARDFYQNKLGLNPRGAPTDDPMVFEAGEDTVITMYHKPEGTKAEHTAASFLVEDIMVTMKELEAKGVIFEDYDLPGLKTVNHIAAYDDTKSAWFKDSEGNILALVQM